MATFTRTARWHFARIGSGTSLCLRERLPPEAERLPPEAERLPGAQLRRQAQQRRRWLDYARTHSIAATCRHCAIARSTYFRWAKRSAPHARSLRGNRSSAPRRVGARTSWRWDAGGRGFPAPSP